MDTITKHKTFIGVRFVSRFWLYLQERFPLFKHVPLILIFSTASISYYWILVDRTQEISLKSIITAVISCIFFFLQLRIADEFKDYAEDCSFRPNRAVPRGLITLEELKYVYLVTVIVQAALALFNSVNLLFMLIFVWSFQFLMFKEFWVSNWLKSNPLIYMASHMLIIPLIDLYSSACLWNHYGLLPDSRILYFLLTGYMTGCVFELGRKIYSSEEEYEGSRSYSSHYGITKAVSLWFGVIVMSFILGLTASLQTQNSELYFMLGAIYLSILLLLCVSIVHGRVVNVNKNIELFSGLWVLTQYILLGFAPVII